MWHKPCRIFHPWCPCIKTRCLFLQLRCRGLQGTHNNDVMMGAIASQITSLTIVCSIFYSDADQRKHQSSVSLAFVKGIHRGPVNSPHKWPVTRKMFPFDDVIMVRKPAAHHWVAGLCSARSCAVGLCAGLLVCRDGHPWWRPCDVSTM